MKKPFRDALGRIEQEHWWYRGRQVILERAMDRFIGNPERSLAIEVGASHEAEILSKRTRLVAVDREEINRRSAEVAMGSRPTQRFSHFRIHPSMPFLYSMYSSISKEMMP